MNKRRRYKAKRQRAARGMPRSVNPFWRSGKPNPFDHLRGVPMRELFERCWNGEYDETPVGEED